ncbi:hypothetical protein AeMF1_001119 [Aphanomyces euteiches]|nr:hypothetical protein AeMF1_001119 [Aphanomyces euteiches]KAH9187365.1 hypothetical protein AeNC1_010659 [Aphanomyces euteiches]
MDFLRSIEDDLTLVEAETKKKLPAVKDAAEKGIEKIGQIRQLYAQKVRVEAAPGPGDPIFKHDAILRPFLLACNHSTASQKLLVASFNSIQKLVSWDAITTEAVSNILRVLQIQAERNSQQEIQLKLLQTLLQLLTLAFNKGDEQMTNEDLISQAIWICLHLQSQSGNTITANTAIMTLRQIITMVFDNVMMSHQANHNANLDGAKKVGFLVFQDLCLMSREEAGVWLKRTTFSKILGVELLEAVLTSHGTLFRDDVEFRSMLKQHVKHLITSNLSAASPFPLLLRIMRLASTVLCQFSGVLEEECNTIWLCLIEIVSTGTFSTNSTGVTTPMFLHLQKRPETSRHTFNSSMASPGHPNPNATAQSAVNYVAWHVLLAVEVIHKACGESDVLPALGSYPNHVLLLLARTIAAVVTTSPPSDYKPSQSDVPYRCGLEYLNEQEAPQLQPFYHCLRLSLLTQYHLISALHAQDKLSPLRRQYMLCSMAPFVLNALHCTMRFCREAELVTLALKGYHLLSDVNAHTRRLVPVECRPIGVLSIEALCVFSFPVPETTTSRLVKCITGAGVLTSMDFHEDTLAIDGTINASGIVSTAVDPCLLTWKEMHAMKTLFRTIHTMEQELNEVEWRTLFAGFEIIVGLSALKQKTKGVGQRIGTGPNAIKVEDEDVEQQLVMLGQSILEYFQTATASTSVHGPALPSILRALRSLCAEHIQISTPSLSTSTAAALANDQDSPPMVESELQQFLALWAPDQQTAWDVVALPFTHHLKTYGATLGLGNGVAFTPSFSLRMFVQLGKTHEEAWPFVMEELVAFSCLWSAPVPHLAAFQTFTTEAVFQLVAVALGSMPTLSQDQVTAFVVRVIQSENMKERGLVGLLDLLQTSGHLINDGWPNILQALSTSAEYDARCQVVAFKSVRLIVDDLVAGMTNSRHREACISCVGVYATHAKDINISLTAINELWSLADKIAKTELALWPTAFSELKRIALDSRPEVRNCAINTLFGTAVTHGANFRLEEWTTFLQGTVLPLAEELASIVPEEAHTLDPTASAASVVLHHSRDSAAKQYDESRVLVLTGISRVLQTNTASLLHHADWFIVVWKALIYRIASSCDRAMSKEVVLAAIQTLHTLLQIASTASQDPSNATPLRAAVGMRVVNGVCTPANSNTSASEVKKPTLLSRDPQLWMDAFALLLRLADDRGNNTNGEEIITGGSNNLAQEQEIASAMVTVFVSIYTQARDTELHDTSKILQILNVFDRSMRRYVLTTQTSVIAVTTNSLHARILNSYEDCGYFDEAVHSLIIQQLAWFVQEAYRRSMVFVARHAVQSLAKAYAAVSPVAQAETFAQALEAIAPLFETKHATVPATATASEKATLLLWKNALPTLLALISHGLPVMPQSAFNALLQVVETVLVPHAPDDDQDAAALELSLLDCLVQTMMSVQVRDTGVTTHFVALLTCDLTNDSALAAACIDHLTRLSAPSNNSNSILREVCRRQLNAITIDAITAFLGDVRHRPRLLLLLTSLSSTTVDPESVLELFPSLCLCITNNDVEIRTLVQRVLLQSSLPEACLPLLRRRKSPGNTP